MTDFKISGLTLESYPGSGHMVELEGPDGLPYYTPLSSLLFGLGGTQRKNIILNGGFQFAQRQDPDAATTYNPGLARGYCADRWALSNENASVNYNRVDTLNVLETGIGSRYYGKVTKITAAGKVALMQVIEGVDIAPLRGRSVRFSLKMKMAVAGAMPIRAGLMQLSSAGTVDTVPANAITAWNGAGAFPTFGANLTAINVNGEVENFTTSGAWPRADLTTAWVRYSAFCTIPTNCKNLVFVIFSDEQLNALDELCISEVGLYDGAGLADWSPEPVADEFRRLQRFYCKTFPVDTAPAQNAGLAGSKRGAIKVAGAVATSWQGEWWQFPERMRDTPTLTFFNPSAANAFVRNVTLGTNATATAAANQSDTCAHITATGLAAWVVGNDSAIHITAEAEL